MHIFRAGSLPARVIPSAKTHRRYERPLVMQFQSIPSTRSQSSYWLAGALASTQPESQSLRTSCQADVCIIGGGYTGLWTAIELIQRDPSMRIVVLEAQVCGSGASGTNAGFVMNLWPKFSALVSHAGRDEAIRIAGETSRAIGDIEEFVNEHKIEANFERAGWLWASTSPDQDDSWEETLLALDGIANQPFHRLSAEEAQRLGGQAVRAGVLDPTSATVQPAALALGLRRVARKLGVEIYEHSPVRSISGRGRPIVETEHARVTADSVVLAINAWTSNLSWARRHLITTASDNMVVVPGASSAGSNAESKVGVSDSRRLLNYWRSTPDGALLFGKGGVGLGFRNQGSSSLFGEVPNLKLLRQNFEQTFPSLAHAPIINTWRAPVEYSMSSLPFFVADPNNPRVFVGTGYSGDGVGPSRLGARILASLATDQKDEWSESALTRLPSGRLPPEPFRFFGGQLVRTAIIRADDLRYRGKKVDLVTSGITALDPTSWV
ncbi:NAD(P)/FAD-dependent oxidoreductase [Paenarthrobacter sp. TA1.8]|uniref:NAD(P)/FAD-dependent oxidoreductase n=1 Tax=Paenarthrobacter sp. TA1.8 TaxID=3400219 RepID=UPI003B436721